MKTITLAEVQEDHRTVCLWNGAGWTRCWAHSEISPVHGDPLPPKLYRHAGDAQAQMTRKAKAEGRFGTMIKPDLEAGLLKALELGPSVFAVARLEYA